MKVKSIDWDTTSVGVAANTPLGRYEIYQPLCDGKFYIREWGAPSPLSNMCGWFESDDVDSAKQFVYDQQVEYIMNRYFE